MRFGSMMALVVAASLFVASSASAATEVGNDCKATSGSGGVTFTQLAKAPGSPLPIEAPAGVITRWKVNSGIPTPVAQQLVILRQTGKPNEFLTVAESASATIVEGLNSFETRIPVQAGDRLGAAPGSSGGAIPAGLYCPTGNPADLMGAFAGDVAPGSTNTYPPNANFQVAISAIVEPDADHDGFGDETQDKCPQLAALQTPCPPVTLSASSAAQKGLASVLVTASTQASVTVTGAVNLGKGKSAQLSGGTQIVVPGTISKFILLFPQKLKAKLKQLSPKKFLILNLAATAPNPVGTTSASNLVVKLRGQAKAKQHKKAKHHA